MIDGTRTACPTGCTSDHTGDVARQIDAEEFGVVDAFDGVMMHTVAVGGDVDVCTFTTADGRQAFPAELAVVAPDAFDNADEAERLGRALLDGAARLRASATAA